MPNPEVVVLTTNYFEILTSPDWCIYQYKCHISPHEDRIFVRKAIVHRLKPRLGEYLFDGTMLTCANRLDADPLVLDDIFNSPGGELKTSSITIKLVKELSKEESIEIINTLIRRCCESRSLGLTLMNVDCYYDPLAKIELSTYHLELWPGYKTSVKKHGNKILLCVELKHKVLWTNTVLDLINELSDSERRNRRGQRSPTDWKKTVLRAVIGSPVMTKYNQKTYVIYDVAFDQNPRETFDMKGKQVSFADYIKQKYDINVNDMLQPMLICKQRGRGDAMAADIALIPELCHMMGISDDMRENNRLMSAIEAHTNLDPESHQKALVKFVSRLRDNDECTELLQAWNVSISDDSEKFEGKTLKEEDPNVKLNLNMKWG